MDARLKAGHDGYESISKAVGISYDRATGNGCYFMRMQPGAVTVPHVHAGTEDFFILEGDLVDDDGTVFKAGDFVSYAPGTRHNSWTENGCFIAVFEWGKSEETT